jgi:hypothetical protein
MKKNKKSMPLRPERGRGRTKAGRAAPVEAREAGVWIYGEVLPKGLLSQEEGALLIRAASFVQSGAVPPELVHALAAEAEAFVGP